LLALRTLGSERGQASGVFFVEIDELRSINIHVDAIRIRGRDLDVRVLSG
jgi:hypothetical protein